MPMSDLREMCESLGFTEVKTYIASGNVVFSSKHSRQAVKAALESRLAAYAGKKVPVFVRTAAELEAVLHNNPFGDRDPRFTVAIMVDEKLPKDALADVAGQADDEELRIGKEEIYVYYGSGMARSKLRIPAASRGTARNMNTIRKMVELASR